MLNSNSKYRKSKGNAADSLRRVVSLEDAFGGASSRRRSKPADVRNASWNMTTIEKTRADQPRAEWTANRRGSNGVIPGQQLPSFPPPTLNTTQQPTDTLPEDPRDDCGGGNRANHRSESSRRIRSRIYDEPAVIAGYNSVPLIELNRLPRGGISLETEAIGRIQVSNKIDLSFFKYITVTFDRLINGV